MTSTIISGNAYTLARTSRDETLTQLDDHLKNAGLRLTTANAGDHPAVLSFLQSVHFQPSAAEFLAQTDHPHYEPTDRLLIWNRSQIVGHLRIAYREFHFGGLRFPSACLCDMAIARPFRGQGLGSALLAAAERRAETESCALATLWTKKPHEYSAHQWVRCGGQSHSVAGTRHILSCIHGNEDATEKPIALPTDETKRELNIRLWRHVEEDALVHLRDQKAPHSFGWTARNAGYWRWLLSRRGYDRIYVAIDGPPKLELDESINSIVGYAVMREDRIVELVTSPERRDAAPQLLARACSDAIERDLDPVRFDAPADDGLHQLMSEAGGTLGDGPFLDESTVLVKMFHPMAFLKQIMPLVHLRAKASGVDLPTELGLMLDGVKYQLVLTRRSARIEEGKLGRSYLTCSSLGLTQLLLGGRPFEKIVEDGLVSSSTRVAEQLTSVVFPRLALWFPPFDELPSLT